MTKPRVTLFWFRRDLRLEDNAALFHALKSAAPVQPIFIFDTNILNKLEDKDDARVTFIHQEVSRLHTELHRYGASLDVRVGEPLKVWQQLTQEYAIHKLFANRDYEPYARERDKAVFEYLQEQDIPFIAKKDHVIFEKNEVLKKDGLPYTVYTPYSKVWKSLLNDFYQKSYPSVTLSNWNRRPATPIPTLKAIGFQRSALTFPERQFPSQLVANYHNTRDIPAIVGTSRLSLHLRFGTVSIRTLVRNAVKTNEKYLNELIWRDFYQSILWHFPKVVEENFKPKYDQISWRNNESEFQAWCKGQTGYPIVDAGMRELNETAFMHNRVRMIVASFLTKHLLIDWRWGEAYFARKLLDFDLASNNGGWQWAAGTGVDAAPYFRIFNPAAQSKKFDPQGHYIKKWIPELLTPDYPKPIVNHKLARERALNTYREGLNG